MRNSIKESNSKEAKSQLKRADVKKNILIKKIYKEYEIYFKIVRKSIITSIEKGIFGLYSDISTSDKSLNLKELNNFLKNNINLLIYTKLPLITIEQLNIRDISDSQKQLINLNALKELGEFNESQTANFDKDLIKNEPLEFNCKTNSNTYEYYESLHDDELLSVNLDERVYLNSFSGQSNTNNFYDAESVFDSFLELIEEKNDNRLNDYENISDKISDVFISSHNLDFFEYIDKSFNNLLLNLSYDINSELVKIKLIKRVISEDIYIYLSNNNYIIKHPLPFVISYDLNINKLMLNNKSYDIYLFNINSVELEYYNLDLSICRNNINILKNKFNILNKKQRYWKHKYFTLRNLN